ncbi:metal-dependent transcriptional regulator [candidate division KSB1 bacterium]
MTLTPSLEDYLESIWIIGLDKKVVRVKDIEKFLDVKTSSVIGALKTLAKKKLIIHERYGYIDLTETGIEKSKEIYKKHKIIAEFLEKILSVDKKTALSDACKIEHHIDQQTLRKLNKFMLFVDSHPDGKPDWLTEFHNSVK